MNIRLSLFLSASFVVGLVQSGFASEYGDDDTNSVYSEASYMHTGNHRSGLGVNLQSNITIDLPMLQNYFYFPDHAAMNGRGVSLQDIRTLISYNTYPFHMPSDDVTTETFYFNEKNMGSDVAESTINVLKKVIPQYVDQFIIENVNDMGWLSDLSNQGDKKGYKFHFWGNQTETYGNFLRVLDAWNHEDSRAYCEHLDFAMRVTDQSSFLADHLPEILARCPKLKTLSLRFMHMNDAGLLALSTHLQGYNSHLERLILSFNDLTDKLFEENHALTNIIGNLTNFPRLSVIDIKGNNIYNPESWSLSFKKAMNKRLHNTRSCQTTFMLIHGLNNLTCQAHAYYRTQTPLSTMTTSEQFIAPQGYTYQDATAVKTAFDRILNHGLNFKAHWIPSQQFNQAYHQSFRYAHMADYVVVLRHGAHNHWHSLNLGAGIDFSPVLIHSFFKHVRDKESVKLIHLDRVFTDRDGNSRDVHLKIANVLNQFTDVQILRVSDPNLSQQYNYGDAAHSLNTLKRLDFSHTEMGEVDSPQSDFNQFLAGLRYWSDSRISFRYLNLSHNHLSDCDMSSLVSVLNDMPSLMFLDLSQNYIRFESEEIQCYFAEWMKKGEILYHIDISKNPISSNSMTQLLTQYDAMPFVRNVPVVKINSVTPEGRRTDFEYLGSPESLYRLGNMLNNILTFRHEKIGGDIFVDQSDEDILKQKNIYMRQAFKKQQLHIVRRVQELLQSKDPYSNTEAIERYTPTPEDILKARVILSMYCRDMPTEEESLYRAKIVRYIAENRDRFFGVGDLSNQNHDYLTFRLLSQSEQDKRIVLALHHVMVELLKERQPSGFLSTDIIAKVVLDQMVNTLFDLPYSVRIERQKSQRQLTFLPLDVLKIDGSVAGGGEGFGATTAEVKASFNTRKTDGSVAGGGRGFGATTSEVKASFNTRKTDGSVAGGGRGFGAATSEAKEPSNTNDRAATQNATAPGGEVNQLDLRQILDLIERPLPNQNVPEETTLKAFYKKERKSMNERLAYRPLCDQFKQRYKIKIPDSFKESIIEYLERK